MSCLTYPPSRKSRKRVNDVVTCLLFPSFLFLFNVFLANMKRICSEFQPLPDNVLYVAKGWTYACPSKRFFLRISDAYREALKMLGEGKAKAPISDEVRKSPKSKTGKETKVVCDWPSKFKANAQSMRGFRFRFRAGEVKSTCVRICIWIGPGVYHEDLLLHPHIVYKGMLAEQVVVVGTASIDVDSQSSEPGIFSLSLQTLTVTNVLFAPSPEKSSLDLHGCILKQLQLTLKKDDQTVSVQNCIIDNICGAGGTLVTRDSILLCKLKCVGMRVSLRDTEVRNSASFNGGLLRLSGSVLEGPVTLSNGVAAALSSSEFLDPLVATTEVHLEASQCSFVGGLEFKDNSRGFLASCQYNSLVADGSSAVDRSLSYAFGVPPPFGSFGTFLFQTYGLPNYVNSNFFVTLTTHANPIIHRSDVCGSVSAKFPTGFNFNFEFDPLLGLEVMVNQQVQLSLLLCCR